MKEKLYYVTAVLVIDAPSAQAAVDQVVKHFRVDLLGEPVLEVTDDETGKEVSDYSVGLAIKRSGKEADADPIHLQETP